MDGLLNGLGTKFAERWVTLLALPGLLFALTLALSWWLHPLGAAHALDPALLSDRLDQAPPSWLASTPHRLLFAALVTLTAAASAGVATELSRPIARLWLGRGPRSRRLLAPFLRRRTRQAESQARRGHRLNDRYLPERATRIGDHLLLAEKRVAAQYEVALVRVWPRLWQLCDDSQRAPTQLAWDRYTAASVRAAWSLGYLALGTLWWPAAVAGAALCLSAWTAARRAAAELGILVEALTDVKLQELATALGVSLPHGRFTKADGPVVENILDKGTFLPVTPDAGDP
ncbi:hypothetical protein DVA86_30055 [Streptomyces armeniacus]|uniref:Uncharacterized protein n=1 Tax=Streptomyces armeniacus TaxID=83291 RepID=A0A345XX37_9ACTN|nr:hypothetical protein [Streptomyces armeniacus]AXK36203.1 hypothetical protein DVA86_30055 [Streptomyces armeniacus]